MNVQIMVTIHGANKADLVKVLSEKTHTLGGKWLNSKISHIDNYFAGLLKVEIAASNIEQLANEFRNLGIKVEAVELENVSPVKSTYLNLNIDAKDRPGLVHDISQVLSDNSITVENMECHRLGLADISGTVFTSQFKILVNEEFDKQALLQNLQEISEDLVVDLHA